MISRIKVGWCEIKVKSPILSSFSCISPSSCLSFAIVPLGEQLNTWALGGHLEDTWRTGQGEVETFGQDQNFGFAEGGEKSASKKDKSRPGQLI